MLGPDYPPWTAQLGINNQISLWDHFRLDLLQHPFPSTLPRQGQLGEAQQEGPEAGISRDICEGPGRSGCTAWGSLGAGSAANWQGQDTNPTVG